MPGFHDPGFGVTSCTSFQSNQSANCVSQMKEMQKVQYRTISSTARQELVNFVISNALIAVYSISKLNSILYFYQKSVAKQSILFLKTEDVKIMTLTAVMLHKLFRLATKTRSESSKKIQMWLKNQIQNVKSPTNNSV